MTRPNTATTLNPLFNPQVLDDLGRFPQDELMAAIDLGSNSFHLAIGRVDHGEVRKVVSLSEKVQLAAGLDDNNELSEEAMVRGLTCLTNFNQYLDAVPKSKVRVVATNALRKAENRQVFIDRANQILSSPIEVIAGREEARLIYLGVSHTNAGTDKRLVIDIGGGSTEFIIGKGFDPIEIESLQMGCVAFTKKFFADGLITEKAFDDTQKATETELLRIAKRYKKTGWDNVIGSSGTMKAATLALAELGFDEKGISFEGIKKLKKYLLTLGDSNKIELEGVKPHRRAVFAAGVAQLFALMKVLEIKRIDYSDGALREGVMYDLLGRLNHEDVRKRSIQALAERYSVSKKQANLVMDTCERLFRHNKEALNLTNEDGEQLAQAAKLHEIGLAISHSNHHHHSAYLLQYSDIFGFSSAEQETLATLVLHHRRKLKQGSVEQVEHLGGRKLVHLCLLLRLGVLAHQPRSRHSAKVSLKVKSGVWQVSVGEGNHKALLIHQLQADALQFAKWGVQLVVV